MKKEKTKYCLRCHLEHPISEFTAPEGSNYFVHEVCNMCRELMKKRTDFLIKSDKRFHISLGADYQATLMYREMLVKGGEVAERLFK